MVSFMSGVVHSSTVTRLAWAFVALAGCVIAGCDAGPGDRGQESTAPQEQDWAAQVAAVRAKTSDRIEVTQAAVGDDELQQLAGLDSLRELLIDRGEMTSAGLAVLARLPQLEHVRIRGAKLTDDDLRALCEIKSLQRLNVPQADFTDDGLAALAQLKHLELLRVGSPRVTDAGIQHMSQVQTLRWLHLIEIPITDAAVRPIVQLPKLESLYLDGAKLSDAGYDQLFAARENLHVHVDQRHHDRDPHGHSH
jgi:outer membrane murein-binding lipoprotein Lpp